METIEEISAKIKALERQKSKLLEKKRERERELTKQELKVELDKLTLSGVITDYDKLIKEYFNSLGDHITVSIEEEESMENYRKNSIEYFITLDQTIDNYPARELISIQCTCINIADIIDDEIAHIFEDSDFIVTKIEEINYILSNQNDDHFEALDNRDTKTFLTWENFIDWHKSYVIEIETYVISYKLKLNLPSCYAKELHENLLKDDSGVYDSILDSLTYAIPHEIIDEIEPQDMFIEKISK